MYTTASIHTAAAWSRSVFRIIPGDIIWGGGGGGRGEEEFISRNHGGLAGWFLPSKANPRCGRQRRRRRPPWTFGPCIYIYIYIYILSAYFFPRVSNFSFHPPSRGCRRISPCPSNNLTRVAGSSGSYRKKYYRETDERYIRNERTLLPVLSSPTEKNNGVFFERWKGYIAVLLALHFR